MSDSAKATLQVGCILALIALAVTLTSLQNERVSQRFSGVWWIAFEYSTFAEGVTADSAPTFESNSHGELDEIFGGVTYGWLNDDHISVAKLSCGDATISRLASVYRAKFELTFDGHRTTGPSGHMDQYPAEYVVDRIVRVRPIGDDCIISPTSAVDSTQP